MNYFPIFLQLEKKQILIIGGGEIACRKVDLLLKSKANIRLVSPSLHPYLTQLVKTNQLSYTQKNYENTDLDEIDLVFATTNCKKLNQQIYLDAKKRRIWVNTVDDTKMCEFITPSIVDRSPIQVAISSNGKSPVLIRYLREKLEMYLAQNLSLLSEFAGNKRDLIKAHFDTVDNRRKFWEVFFALPQVENASSMLALEQAFDTLLAEHTTAPASLTLLHAGRDPELLSLKALRLMQQAEFVLFDANLPSVFLELCRRDADRSIYQHEKELIDKLSKLNAKLRICVLSANKKTLDKVQRQATDKYCQFVSALDAK